VELFTLVKREKELHRTIIAFSISHDRRSVRIDGHYPVIEGKKAIFHRYSLRTFDFTGLVGKEQWTTDKFTKSVYDTWMPAHFKDFAPQLMLYHPIYTSNSRKNPISNFTSSSGLSQSLESRHLPVSGDTGDDGVAAPRFLRGDT
jgi:hypothetical protein